MDEIHSHWGHVAGDTWVVERNPGLEDIGGGPADKKLQNYHEQHGNDALLGLQTALHVALAYILDIQTSTQGGTATAAASRGHALVLGSHVAVTIATVIICLQFVSAGLPQLSHFWVRQTVKMHMDVKELVASRSLEC